MTDAKLMGNDFGPASGKAPEPKRPRTNRGAPGN
jgi:hypothetical protein